MINANGHQKDSLKKPKINHHINIWNMKTIIQSASFINPFCNHSSHYSSRKHGDESPRTGPYYCKSRNACRYSWHKPASSRGWPVPNIPAPKPSKNPPASDFNAVIHSLFLRFLFLLPQFSLGNIQYSHLSSSVLLYLLFFSFNGLFKSDSSLNTNESCQIQNRFAVSLICLSDFY